MYFFSKWTQTGHNLLVAYCEYFPRFTWFLNYEEKIYKIILVKCTTHTAKSMQCDVMNKSMD